MKIIFLTLLIMFAIGGIPYLIGWIEWKIKYPIISDTPPMRILSRGDYVTFKNGRRFKFDGRDINLDFVFEDQDTCIEHRMKNEDVFTNISSVSSRYGLKWRKPLKDNFEWSKLKKT